jgi:hypothetical protein
MRRMVLALMAFALLAPGLSHAQSGQPSYWIIKPEPGRAQDPPEPWLAPKYKSPRGTRQHVKPSPRAAEPDQPRVSTPPPPIVVPQTGVALPNMRTLSPSGPRGTESFQDKALRCAHQAGAYGSAAGNRGTYIGTCVTQ